VLVGEQGPVVIDFPQVVSAGGNNAARAMLLRDVNNLTASLGRWAPELLDTWYGEEMWALFEAGSLHPESELTGFFEPTTHGRSRCRAPCDRGRAPGSVDPPAGARSRGRRGLGANRDRAGERRSAIPHRPSASRCRPARVTPRVRMASGNPISRAMRAKRKPEYTISDEPTTSIASADCNAAQADCTRSRGTFFAEEQHNVRFQQAAAARQGGGRKRLKSRPSRSASPSGAVAAGDCGPLGMLVDQPRLHGVPRHPRARTPRHTTVSMRPCRSTTSRCPARACRPSTFCVTSSRHLPACFQRRQRRVALVGRGVSPPSASRRNCAPSSAPQHQRIAHETLVGDRRLAFPLPVGDRGNPECRNGC
jgi:hypothetical protein